MENFSRRSSFKQRAKNKKASEIWLFVDSLLVNYNFIYYRWYFSSVRLNKPTSWHLLMHSANSNVEIKKCVMMKHQGLKSH